MIGTYLGPYELLAEIASGGMATVYRAYQPAVDREAAVKVIHAAILHDEAMRERFRREARLIARLEHPHILPPKGIWIERWRSTGWRSATRPSAATIGTA